MKIFILLSILLASSMALSQPKEIKIKLTNKGDFDVFFHRSQSTTTGAIFGGLIGAGIEMGVDKSKDTEMEKTLIEHTGAINCHELLIESFKIKLNKKEQLYQISDEENSENYKHRMTLTLNIKDCGYKLANQESGELAAFVSFKAKLKEHGSKKLLLDESFMIKSKKHYLFSELLENSDSIKQHIDGVLEKAGKRLANKIIYHKKELK